MDEEWQKAEAICRRHNERHPKIPNVPLQTVFEWLLEVQGRLDLVEQMRRESEFVEDEVLTTTGASTFITKRFVRLEQQPASDPVPRVPLQQLIATWRERASLNIVPEEDGAEIYYTNGQNWALRQCADELDALLSRVPSPPADLWQPIETAPKDGTTVLIARHMDPFGWILGHAQYHHVERLGGAWVARGFGLFGELGLAAPTHWMPLPDPPSGAARA